MRLINRGVVGMFPDNVHRGAWLICFLSMSVCQLSLRS